VALYWLKRNRDILNESWNALARPMDGPNCTSWQTIWSAVWACEEFDEATGHALSGVELPVFERDKDSTQERLTAVLAQADILCRLAGDGVPERVRIWQGFHPTAIVTQKRVGVIENARARGKFKEP
jgi:hypothetical protein